MQKTKEREKPLTNLQLFSVFCLRTLCHYKHFHINNSIELVNKLCMLGRTAATTLLVLGKWTLEGLNDLFKATLC